MRETPCAADVAGQRRQGGRGIGADRGNANIDQRRLALECPASGYGILEARSEASPGKKKNFKKCHVGTVGLLHPNAFQRRPVSGPCWQKVQKRELGLQY